MDCQTDARNCAAGVEFPMIFYFIEDVVERALYLAEAGE